MPRIIAFAGDLPHIRRVELGVPEVKVGGAYAPIFGVTGGDGNEGHCSGDSRPSRSPCITADAT